MNGMEYKMADKIKNYVFLHISIFIYTLTIVTSKLASKMDFLSFKYILCYFGMIGILGVYAILWQQAIKPFKPSVAYSNKSVTIIWTLLFSVIFFKEGITVNNIIGTIVIIAGVVLVTKDE